MKKMLIVDNNTELVESYLLRFFSHLLPMEKVSVTHTSSAREAVDLLNQPWDVILMDYALGKMSKVDLGLEGVLTIHNGATLVKIRRVLERQNKVGFARIIGIADTHVGNSLLNQAGANIGFVKDKVEELSSYLQVVIK